MPKVTSMIYVIGNELKLENYDCIKSYNQYPIICNNNPLFSCRMPFDKARKRKLVDTCGHERCYACMFRNEACPLCFSATGK